MRRLLAVWLCCLVSVSAFAQAERSHKVALDSADHQALILLQQDMESALGDLEDCLPIYQGHRELAIRALYKALVNVDKAVSGQNSAKRKEPLAHDLRAPKVGVKYSEKQVTDSQTHLQQGLLKLQQAQKDLDAAVGKHTDTVGSMVRTHLKMAVKDTDKALSTQPSQA